MAVPHQCRAKEACTFLGKDIGWEKYVEPGNQSAMFPPIIVGDVNASTIYLTMSSFRYIHQISIASGYMFIDEIILKIIEIDYVRVPYSIFSQKLHTLNEFMLVLCNKMLKMMWIVLINIAK